MISDQDKLKIHQALHNKSAKEVEVNGIKYPIEVHTNKCRCVTIHNTKKISWQGREQTVPDNHCFMEQNPNKASEYARLAREGKKVTWDISTWNMLIVDNKFIKNT